LYPNTDEVLATQVRETLCWVRVTPSPVIDSVEEFEALLVKESVPEAVPEAWGAKATVMGTLCPAAMVSGKVTPLRENSALFTLAEDTVTLAPVALSVPGWDVLVPTVTLPKLTDAGETPNWPCAVPVPVCGIESVGFDAFELTVILPVALLAVCGAKVVLKVRLWFGVSVVGRLSPLMLNPVPASVIWEIVTLEPPTLVSVSHWLWLLPTWTL
jgi:hypothetical protein